MVVDGHQEMSRFYLNGEVIFNSVVRKNDPDIQMDTWYNGVVSIIFLISTMITDMKEVRYVKYFGTYFWIVNTKW